MKAVLKNYRQSPRKVRIVANAVRGKKVQQALNSLASVQGKVAIPIHKLIMSAISNAGFKNSEEAKDLSIGEITVDQGIVFKRFRPRAFGRSAPIKKRTSIIKIILQK